MTQSQKNSSSASWRRYRFRLLLLPVAVVLFMFWMGYMSNQKGNAGLFDGKLKPLPATPNCVSTTTIDETKHMPPIFFKGTVEDAAEAIRQVMAAHPRTRLVEEAENYWHFEVTSLIFRFVDDVEFLIDRQKKRIDFRSASRVGHSDLGVNRRRMNAISRDLTARLVPQN